MQYAHVRPAVFQARPNRFVARVLLDGKEETVHVKNTGRCRELLVPGARVYLAEGDNPARKTRYDLVAVEKTLSPKDVESLLKIPLIGVLPDEDDVLLRGAGFSPASRIGKAFRYLAHNVDAGTRRIYDATSRYTGFFGQIKRGLRRSV